MKHTIFFGVLFCTVLMASCDNSPIGSSHRPVLPVLPSNWNEVLGEPHWRLEWIGEGGSWQEWEGPRGAEPEISLPPEWTTPVLAWPFWPKAALVPGLMRPAGAFFPWDAADGKLILSWKGGVEAYFWKELAANAAAMGRLPWYFDWPRFSELLESEDIPENVRLDPWLVDWRELGRKTAESGFDRRRIKSRTLREQIIPGLDGRWIGSSPFAPPLDAPEGGPLQLMAGELSDTWVSAGKILKCSASGWVLIE